MKKTMEPFWWAFFSSGGALSALFVPVLLFLLMIAGPAGWVAMPSYEQVYSLMAPVPVRLFQWVLITLSLLHWGHRFRFTLYDGLQLKHLNELIAVICYGGALAGSAVAARVLWMF